MHQRDHESDRAELESGGHDHESDAPPNRSPGTRKPAADPFGARHLSAGAPDTRAAVGQSRSNGRIRRSQAIGSVERGDNGIQSRIRRRPDSAAHDDAGDHAVGPGVGESGNRVQRQSDTGLPDALKAGVERLSGLAMDDVNVHYNSKEPAAMYADAFTEGTNIHLGAGHEEHLPHEAWHVVQQKRGGVAATVQFKGIEANVDAGLEREADEMGAKASRLGSVLARLPAPSEVQASGQLLQRDTGTIRRSSSGRGVRQFVCGSGTRDRPALDDVINTSAKSSPSDIADQLSESSEAFAALRGQADTEVSDTYGSVESVEYMDKPKKGGGTGPAYYKDGVAYFDPTAPMPTTVLNVVFETANAAQAGRFKKVEDDFNSGVLEKNDLSVYIPTPSDLGALEDDFEDMASKRSLIQEFYEWNSFLIAREALADLSKSYTSSVASVTWELSFGMILECKNFEEYYKVFGKTHRGAVEGTLRQSVKKPSAQGGQVDIGGLF